MLRQILTNVPSDERAGRVQRILQAALGAADPRDAVRRALSLASDTLFVTGTSSVFPLPPGGVRVIGAGKAAPAMALGLLDVLGEQAGPGVLITKHAPEPGLLPERFRVYTGGHPLPSPDSVRSTQVLIRFLQGESAEPLTEQDLVICLISGGGSALMTSPRPGLTLEDLQDLTRQLLACGADIGEINTLRKHLDEVKGGGLARLAAPARLLVLILSDVMGSPLDVIASGPTVPDPTTYADAQAVLHKYGIADQVPEAVRAILQRGAQGQLPESLKLGDPQIENVTNRLVASNLQAAQAALAQAGEEGFHALLLTTYLQGEAAQAGQTLAGVLRQIHETGQPLPRPACLVVGGETTVTLRGEGRGGRNQELALGSCTLLAGLPDVALVSLATDGEDGPTDAAGAVVTGETLNRARLLGLDPQAALRANDSYPFLAALDALLQPGPTGTNVNDLAFLFAF